MHTNKKTIDKDMNILHNKKISVRQFKKNKILHRCSIVYLKKMTVENSMSILEKMSYQEIYWIFHNCEKIHNYNIYYDTLMLCDHTDNNQHRNIKKLHQNIERLRIGYDLFDQI